MFEPVNIKKLQSALQEMGLYKDDIDGLVGPNTLNAIRLFDAFYSDKDSVHIQSAEEVGVVVVPTIIQPLDVDGASLEEALQYVLKNEGGFVNHPADKGGPTNRGITQKTLQRYRGHPVSADDVKKLDYQTTIDIYKKYYWDVINLDQLFDQDIATVIFDIGLLCGPNTSVRFCQEILHIDITKQMDEKTIQALNSKTNTQNFIHKFVEHCIQYFETIVAKNSSQLVFLKGWKNRANRLKTLVKLEDVSTSILTTTTANDLDNTQNILIELTNDIPVTQKDIEHMINWQKKNKANNNPRYWAVFKIGLHSKNKRFYVFDRIEKTVNQYYATHGVNSDKDHDGLATDFSNEKGSLKSSLGLYRTWETYTMAKHGTALKLDGLEDTNSNARERGIVFHGVPYANEEYVQANHKCGRSHGCPAVDYVVAKKLINQLKGGSLLMITNT